MFKILLRTGKFLENQNHRVQYYKKKVEAENKIDTLGKRGVGARPFVVRIKKDIKKVKKQTKTKQKVQPVVDSKNKKKGRHSFSPHHIIRMQ